MRNRLKQMTAAEFVKEILSDERDFQNIILPPYSNVSRYKEYIETQAGIKTCRPGQGRWVWRKPRSWEYGELQAYLKNQDFKKYPINVSGSDLTAVRADGAYLPYLKAVGVDANGANFDMADLSFSTFDCSFCKGAYFIGTSLLEGSFRRTKLNGGQCIGAIFCGSDWYETDVDGTNLSVADIRLVKNLGRARNLERAHFLDTRVTPAEAEIVNNALKTVERLNIAKRFMACS